jgi:hypothetical protein
MNFSNIYRDYLTNLVENQTSKKDEEKSREQTELDEEKHIIAFIKAARDIYISKNALSRQDRDTLIQIAQKYLGGTPEEYEPFTEKIPENSPIRVSAICGNRLDLAVDEHVFGAILDYLGVFDTKRGECIDKFKSEREEALKRKNELDTKIFTEFKKFYNLEKKKATEAGASGKVINREQLEKAMSKLEAIVQDPNKYARYANRRLTQGFFASIDPSLAWMDQTFVQDSSKFIYASELQPERWVKMVIQIEQEVIANGSINAKPKDAKEQFKDIIEGCVKLEQDFKEIMKDRELQDLAKHNGAVNACLRGAGGIVSGMSLTLGAFTYALGAFIPGGAYYAQYLAKLVKWGRRAGKLISNSGSPLDNAESKKRKIHTDTDEDEKEEKEDVSVKHTLKHKHDIKKEEEDQEEGTL